MTDETRASANATTEVFTFGEPTPVLDTQSYLDMFQTGWNGSYYEPPISLDGLTKIQHANVHHESAIQVKTNILTSSYNGHRLLPRMDFKRLVMEYLVFGNAYLEQVPNRIGGVAALKPALAKFMRAKKGGVYTFLNDYGTEHDFAPGAILHLHGIDLNQEIYGLPEYLGSTQSLLLNEASTLFRRKYYVNGSHAGFILYLNDALMSTTDIDAIKEQMKLAKGPGNFKNMLVYAPGGSGDGVKVIPVAEVAAKDEFLNIKNVTRDDVLAAHRIPPQLMGIVPNNTGGFGNMKDAATVFNRNELVPLQSVFLDINDWVGEEVVAFEPYEIEVGGDEREGEGNTGPTAR